MESETPWWIRYRNQPHRKTLSVEKIVRRSIQQICREYVDSCSISGVRQMCDPKIGWLQRMFHIIMFCSLVCLFWYLLDYISVSTQYNSLIVTKESTTYPIGEIDFPAVSLCNINRISKKALDNLAFRLYSLMPEFHNVSYKDALKFVHQAGRLLDFSYEEKWGKGNNIFLDTLFSAGRSTFNILDEMEKLAPACEEMLLRCTWAGSMVPCKTLFTVRRTARGHCCSFNYILDYNSAGSPNGTLTEAKRQRLPGYMHGLNVILDPMLDDYAYPITNYRGFDVLLHEPTQFADLSAGRLVHRVAEPEQAEFLELKSIKQQASPEVRKYPQHVRKCLLKDELAADFNKMYSYSACIVRCRIKAIQTLCKCTPYFLPAGKTGGKICSMNELKCLNKYKEKLLYLYPINPEKTEGLEIEMEDSLYCPDCLPDCELTKHLTKSYKTPTENMTNKMYFNDEFTEGINMTNKCILSVYHAVSVGAFDRLDIVAYWFEVLSNIGGYGGVILGLSIFNIVEVVYFVLVRFIIILRHNYIINH